MHAVGHVGRQAESWDFERPLSLRHLFFLHSFFFFFLSFHYYPIRPLLHNLYYWRYGVLIYFFSSHSYTFGPPWSFGVPPHWELGPLISRPVVPAGTFTSSRNTGIISVWSSCYCFTHTQSQSPWVHHLVATHAWVAKISSWLTCATFSFWFQSSRLGELLLKRFQQWSWSRWSKTTSRFSTTTAFCIKTDEAEATLHMSLRALAPRKCGPWQPWTWTALSKFFFRGLQSKESVADVNAAITHGRRGDLATG